MQSKQQLVIAIILTILSATSGSDLFHEYSETYVAREAKAGRQLVVESEACTTKSPTHEESLEMIRVHSEWKENNSHRRLQDETIVVPVYLHAMQLSNRVGRVTSQDRVNIMATLNKRFADTPFVFELYGFDKRINAAWYRCEDEEGMKLATKQGSGDVLNIWLCNTHLQSNGQIGFSYYPPIARSNMARYDGIVAMNPGIDVFQDVAVFNGIAHEAGHFLGLTHTFEGQCSTQASPHFASLADYTFAGDGIDDTPAHDGPTFYKQAGRNDCWQSLSPKLNTCGDGPDPIDNLMNYLPGICYERSKSALTPQQIQRMVSQYEKFRYRGTKYERKTTQTVKEECGKKSAKCASGSDCCGSLACIAGNSGRRCQACRTRNQRCRRNSDCCNMSCQSGRCTSR